MVLRTLVMVPAASDLQQAPEQTARSQVRRFVFIREQLADGARSLPRVTSAHQKTGCANRNCTAWTADKITPSAGSPSGGLGVPGRHRGDLPSSSSHELRPRGPKVLGPCPPSGSGR